MIWFLPRVYRGHIIRRVTFGMIRIEKDGKVISYAQSLEDAMQIIDRVIGDTK